MLTKPLPSAGSKCAESSGTSSAWASWTAAMTARNAAKRTNLAIVGRWWQGGVGACARRGRLVNDKFGKATRLMHMENFRNYCWCNPQSRRDPACIPDIIRTTTHPFQPFLAAITWKGLAVVNPDHGGRHVVVHFVQCEINGAVLLLGRPCLFVCELHIR